MFNVAYNVYLLLVQCGRINSFSYLQAHFHGNTQVPIFKALSVTCIVMKRCATKSWKRFIKKSMLNKED